MNAGTNEQFSQTSKVILFFFLFSEKYFFNNSTIITYNIWIRSEFYSDRFCWVYFIKGDPLAIYSIWTWSAVGHWFTLKVSDILNI